MHPTTLLRVSQQTDAADVMSLVVSDEGCRRIEHVSNRNNAFCYESSTNEACLVRESHGPEGIKGLKGNHRCHYLFEEAALAD
nr:hypothetical protein HmN_000504300 [Hymenolepis microstoma]